MIQASSSNFIQVQQVVLVIGNSVSIDNIDNRRLTEKHRQDDGEEITEDKSSSEKKSTNKLSGQEQISSKQLSPLSPQSEFEDVIDDHESDLSLSDAPLKCPATFTDEEVKTTGTAIPIMSTERFHYLDKIKCPRANIITTIVTSRIQRSRPLPQKESSHTQQILSLSHILLLKPKQHCPLILEVFGGDLLESMHKDVIKRFTKHESEFDKETLIRLTRIVKRLLREEITRDKAFSELQILAVGRSYGERVILKAIRNIIERVPRTTLKSSVGEVELCTTYVDPILCTLFMDPDRGDFLRWPNKQAYEPESKKAGQLYDALYVMVEVGHVNVPMSLEQVPAFLASLIISNAFWDNCIASIENKEPSRRSTLDSPSFKEIIDHL
ncbi:C2H2-type zinc finger transcription factor [Rhizophagus irregularis DAOM 181602=DAOM 197198]|nr:C2H2-type zinc finger transcription factor [Rhizophagus irregularis DAOM 181602=DAOM 197198]